jgi:hypothetical protein
MSLSGSTNASTASRGVLPGKGDQHRNSSNGWVVGILVLSGVPLGEKLVRGDVERLSCRVVQHDPALFARDLHYLDLMI